MGETDKSRLAAKTIVNMSKLLKRKYFYNIKACHKFKSDVFLNETLLIVNATAWYIIWFSTVWTFTLSRLDLKGATSTLDLPFYNEE